MSLSKYINAFSQLGLFIKQTINYNSSSKSTNLLHEKYGHKLNDLISSVHLYNGWFTVENVKYALEKWSKLLSEQTISDWLKHYPLRESTSPKNIGIIMAGNIPLVGFHDFLCVLISGNKAIVKLSSDDDKLLPFLTEVLISIEPGLASQIELAEGQLKKLDAIIATGSNNSSRYFEYYFGKYPHIIRKNRNSIAVLDGTESDEDLHLLGKDIFQYYGLGCRSISKLMVPEGYSFESFFKNVFSYSSVINNNKYVNNYEYNKTIYLMNGEKLLENGFVLLKEDIGIASPIGVIYFEQYKDKDSLSLKLKADGPNIQCIVSNNKNIPNVIPFGTSQNPQLSDYADGIDVMQFLLKI